VAKNPRRGGKGREPFTRTGGKTKKGIMKKELKKITPREKKRSGKKKTADREE